jgi:hypothetical protein
LILTLWPIEHPSFFTFNILSISSAENRRDEIVESRLSSDETQAAFLHGKCGLGVGMGIRLALMARNIRTVSKDEDGLLK